MVLCDVRTYTPMLQVPEHFVSSAIKCVFVDFFLLSFLFVFLISLENNVFIFAVQQV